MSTVSEFLPIFHQYLIIILYRERERGEERVITASTVTVTSLNVLITRNEPPTQARDAFLAEITFLLHYQELEYNSERLLVYRKKT